MKKQFVTPDIASKLKGLGFNEECLAYYSEQFFYLTHDGKGTKNSLLEISNRIRNEVLVSAPLWQQAIDWINANLLVSVVYDPDKIFLKARIVHALDKHIELNSKLP